MHDKNDYKISNESGPNFRHDFRKKTISNMTIFPSQDSVIWRTWIDLDLTYLVAQSNIIDVPRRYSPE